MIEWYLNQLANPSWYIAGTCVLVFLYLNDDDEEGTHSDLWEDFDYEYELGLSDVVLYPVILCVYFLAWPVLAVLYLLSQR